MSLTFNGIEVETVIYNGDEVDTVLYNGEPVYEPTGYYLSFIEENEEPFTLNTYDNKKAWNGTLYYSTDAENWLTWGGTTTINSSSDGKLYLRGVSNTQITPTGQNWVLSSGKRIKCRGNIETLLDYRTVENGNHPTASEKCYYFMFDGCTSLITAPKLPATSVPEQGYQCMFRYCTSLIAAPKLPAMVLHYGSYSGMFRGCTSLTTAPELPAINIWGAGNCYAEMFRDCTALTTPPSKLPATSLESYSSSRGGQYEWMFANCSSLVTAPEISVTNISYADYVCRYMFQNCVSLKIAPELNITSFLPGSCFQGMFDGCTNLTTPPTKLTTGGTTMGGMACAYMFRGCTSLTTAPEFPNSVNEIRTDGCSKMFYGCTSLTTAPELPTKKLKSNCYKEMFSGCINLVKAPVNLPATTLESDCYLQIFYGCTSLTGTIHCPTSVASDSNRLTANANNVPNTVTVLYDL